MVKSNLTSFFSVTSCGWTIVGQSAEHFLSVDGLGMWEVVGLDMKSSAFNCILLCL